MRVGQHIAERGGHQRLDHAAALGHARDPHGAATQLTLAGCGLRYQVCGQDRARNCVAIFRYSDVPGMIGRVGTVLGEHGINIASTAVGREPDHAPESPAGGGNGRLAVMVVTVDSPVPDDVIAAILALVCAAAAALPANRAARAAFVSFR